ncbi:MAG: hypothetical protein ACK4SS_03475, partial [Cypionkella sp.]
MSSPRPVFAFVFLALSLGVAPRAALAEGAASGLAGAYLAAQIAVNSADYRAADTWFARAAQLDPQNTDILRGAMIAALSLGDLPRAGALAKSIEDLGAGEQNTTLARIALMAQQKDYAAILASQSAGATLGPLLDPLLAGWAHIGLGQMNDGLAQFDQLIATNGLEGFGLHHKSIALALAGNFDGAASALSAPQAGFVLQSRRGTILFAQLLANLGQTVQAAEVLQPRANAGDAKVAAVMAQIASGNGVPLSGIEDAASGMAEAF